MIKQLTIIFLIIFTAQTIQGQHMIQFEKGGKYGFVNESGDTIIKPVIVDPLTYFDDVAIFYTNHIYLIHRDGRVIKELPLPNSGIYGAGFAFSCGLLVARDSLTNKLGYINNKGQWIIQPKFYEVEDFKYCCAAVWENSNIHVDLGSSCGTPVTHMKWGVIRKDGSYLIRPVYDLPPIITENEIIFDSYTKTTYVYDHNGWRIR